MGRLFWKIFLWFWLALALLNLAVGWGVKLYFEQADASTEQRLETQVNAIALALDQGDKTRAQRLARSLAAKNKWPIFVITPEGRDVLERPIPPRLASHIASGQFDSRFLYHAETEVSSGERYHIVARKRPPKRGHFGRAPLWIALSITLLVSTLVCYLLAKYLSKPVSNLSNATHQLAAGNLDVRIGPMKRRDEIADLAGDFDRMAEQLQSLVNSQKKLLQDVSHELRSPLARLQVALALAQRNDGDQQRYFDRLHRDIERLDFLIGEVLTLSRIDTVDYPKERFSISELCQEIVRDCALEAEQKQCRLMAEIEPGIEISGRSELLRRAIENILRNAIKFSPDDSLIAFSLARKDGWITTQVSDQGEGVPESDALNLFDAFARADTARDHSISGYGLGLSIAKKAVDLHRGTITLANRSPRGLVATIRLPVQEAI
jgi:signal transduction histidine kinase